MEKTITHFVLLFLFFFGSWFLLSRIDFVGIFEIEQLTRTTEHRLGEIAMNVIRRGDDELESDSLNIYIDSLKIRLCRPNGISGNFIAVHILENGDVNAFALPDRHLIIYTGLIKYCGSAEELAGVMAHEIAHMERDHVMKKLLKEIGLAMILTAAGGEGGGEIPREIVRLLSSTAFDREQESEADALAVHMMAKSGIDPEQFANFLFRLSREKNDIPKHFELLSTHPNSQDRAAEILRLRKKEVCKSRPALSIYSWDRIKEMAVDYGKDSEEY